MPLKLTPWLALAQRWPGHDMEDLLDAVADPAALAAAQAELDALPAAATLQRIKAAARIKALSVEVPTPAAVIPVKAMRGVAGRELRGQRREILQTMVDVYKEARLDKEFKGVDENGNERYGYPHSPDLFLKSDITGAKVRYYVTLPDGRKAHPTELFPDYTQTQIDAEMSRRAFAEKLALENTAREMSLSERYSGDSVQAANMAFRERVKQTLNPGRQIAMTALYEKDGRFYRSGSQENVTRLPAAGWTIRAINDEFAAEIAKAGIEYAVTPRAALDDAADANDDLSGMDLAAEFAMNTNALDAVVVPIFDAVGIVARLKLSAALRSHSAELSDVPNGAAGVLARVRISGKIKAILAQLGAGSVEAEPELSDDPNSPNYRFKDTGHIADSRKERAAAQIKQWASEGRAVRATEIDWNAIEQNPRAAALTITKSNLFGETDWEALKAAGMEPGTAFLIDRVYASIAPQPAETATIKGERIDNDSAARIKSYDATEGSTRRKDYAVALSTIRERLEGCLKADEVLTVLDAIKDELLGSQMDASEADAYSALQEQYMTILKRKMALDQEERALSDAAMTARNAVSTLKWSQEKRERKKWKRDPAVDAEIARLTPTIDATIAALEAWRAAHPEIHSRMVSTPLPGGGSSSRLQSPMRDEMQAIRDQQRVIQNKARARNIAASPLTRGWLTFGERFFKLLHFRSYKGSDTFMSHVTNVRNGRVKDWSWTEKATTTTRKPGEAKVAFQLQVVESHERIGGRPVKPESTQALKDMMGFRDIQSGNWVLKDPTSARFHIEQTAGAMFDMADMLGIDEKALGLGGRLAMAFGARGTGGKNAARAHYEPVERVINLTKMGGGGTLAHEYFHAVDNMLSELVSGQPGAKKDFATNSPETLPDGPLRAAMRAVRSAMIEGTRRPLQIIEMKENAKSLALTNVNATYPQRTAVAIKNAGNATDAVLAVDAIFSGRSSGSKNHKTWRMIAAAYYSDVGSGTNAVALPVGPPGSNFYAESVRLDNGEAGKYWSQIIEMGARAFQSYMEDKLESAGRKNDYLSAMADNKFYQLSEEKPYPEGEERTRINAAFDQFFAGMREGKVLENASGNKALMDSIFGPAAEPETIAE
ncbi:LPD1 domain-containing protein [Nevskia ramosa]|uniref:LPD1 domain-containing protein n=1 Tax=Nevskia ramosa TaxID=64002 RepID=UPI003D0ABFEB